MASLSWRLNRRAFSQAGFRGGAWSSSLQDRIHQQTLKSRIQYLDSVAGAKVPASAWHALPLLVLFTIWIAIVLSVVRPSACASEVYLPSDDITGPSRPSYNRFSSEIAMPSPTRLSSVSLVASITATSSGASVATAALARTTVVSVSASVSSAAATPVPTPDLSVTSGGAGGGGGSDSLPLRVACSLDCPTPNSDRCMVGSSDFFQCMEEVNKPRQACVEKCDNMFPRRRGLYRRALCTNSGAFNG
ncbi:uncharacterized protein EV422DRAFT_372174 [Fimicolochytrium jonesii]|uniref:uncharacterized protein n=1 Tax=Fimicolochytrium jonesii TaxID=1396493 RepID=UPI0022FF3410|nr:uncharacterized protein EV422DRAFT_372174 [Fimicolochytrium jonesii]KAI8815539.1 hypothetical protein EV422DRAFT_372174 [Fimicolochytrium jonesii]